MFSDDEIAESFAEGTRADRVLSFMDVFDHDGLSAKLHPASLRRWGFSIRLDATASDAYLARWRAENRAHVRQYQREWRRRRRAHARAYLRQWRAENRARVRQHNRRQWLRRRAAMREYQRQWRARQRARQRQRTIAA